MPRRRPDDVKVGLAIGLAGVAVITAIEIAFVLPAAVPALLLLIPVTACSTLATRRIGTFVAVLAATSFAVFSVEPVGTPAVRIGADVSVLVTFVVVAVVVGYLTNRRSRDDRNALDARRSALLSGVSHDLRSPLTTIRAISSDLLGSSERYDDETRDELLAQVVDESARLDRIIGTLLSAGSIQAGVLKPQLHHESLDSIIASSATRLTRGDAEARVAIDLPADLPQVEVDAVQIDQVLTNLLENSLRHSGTHEPVQVTAAWPSKAQGGRFVDVSVIDRGIGFADDVRAHLFEPFNAASNAGGTTGLGLAVCRSIVTAHGGTISVDEQAGRGAQITFSLPVTPTSNNPAGRG